MFNTIRKFFGMQERSFENPSVPLAQAYQYLASQPTSSGVPVNRQTVLGLSPYTRSVTLIANKIAKCDCQTFVEKGDSSLVPDKKHAAWYLLMKRPNELMTPFTLKQVVVHHVVSHGNAYIYVDHDEAANPTGLLILDPEQTCPVKENGRTLYVTHVSGQPIKLLPEFVCHIKGLGYDGFVGYSVVDILREQLGYGLALNRYGSKFFANNAAPKIAITLPPTLKDPEKVKRFRDDWMNIHSGLDNSHKVALLEAGTDIKTFGGDNQSSQFLESLDGGATS